MTAVTGAGRPVSRGTVPADRAGSGSGFGLGPGAPSSPSTTASTSAIEPGLRFTALDGLRGVAVPLVLAFAVRAELARLNPPAPLQYLADGGYVLVVLFFVLAGFLLCRPLSAVLTGAGAGRFFVGLVRRIAPLHLLAWAITFGWLATGTSPGTVWDWTSSLLLLNGAVGPARTGYPVSWSVSAALICVVLLVGAALALAAVLALLPGRRRRAAGQAAPAALAGRPAPPGRLVTAIAGTAAVLGTAALILSGPNADGTVGRAAIGQALLGLGAGMLAFRVLEGATGTLKTPRSGTVPAPRPAPGLGSMLALAALLFCVYRSDLVHELNLLPVFPAAAALVYFLALPHETGRAPVNRVLDTGLLQWLGSRSLALYLLHGPVQLTVERLCELRGLDRASTPVGYGVLGAVVLGCLIAAELAHRLLERPFAAPVPAPVAAVSMYRQPRSRPERISQINLETIPSELRLLPLPRKSPASAAAGVAAGQAVGTDADHDTGKAVGKATGTSAARSAKPASPSAAAPIGAAADGPSTQPIDLPAGRSARKAVATNPVRKPAAKPAEAPAASGTAKAPDSAAPKPPGKAVRKPAVEAIELPADKPSRRRKPGSTVVNEAEDTIGTAIDLDRPTRTPDAQILDADAEDLDAAPQILDADAPTLDADAQQS